MLDPLLLREIVGVEDGLHQVVPPGPRGAGRYRAWPSPSAFVASDEVHTHWVGYADQHRDRQRADGRGAAGDGAEDQARGGRNRVAVAGPPGSTGCGCGPVREGRVAG